MSVAAPQSVDVHGALELMSKGCDTRARVSLLCPPLTRPLRTLYVDVRTPEEYAAGHAKGAVSKTSVTNPDGAGWVPVPGFTDGVKALIGGKTDAILVGCQSGKRSSMACATLAEAGIACINVDGGFGAWSAAGLPVEK